MGVEKIFWSNPYLKEIQAVVTSADMNRITLDKTIFFAFSGGQESDKGTINGFEVLDAEKIGKEICYTINCTDNLEIGDSVLVRIDWARRYKIMRLHFAAELILELVNQKYNYPEKIGAHIGEDKARLDFKWEGNISGIFPVIEEEFAKIIENDYEIISGYEDVKQEQRYWELPDFAKVPCAGTHLKRTGEIGEIKLKRNNIGKGKERIEISLSKH